MTMYETTQETDLSDFVASTELALQDLRHQLDVERQNNKRDHDAWAKERAELLGSIGKFDAVVGKLPASGTRVVIPCEEPDFYEEFSDAIERVLQDKLRPPSEASQVVDFDVTDCGAVPCFLESCDVEGGGCDGLHGGACAACCDSWSFSFTALLSTVWMKGGRRYARFQVELSE